MIYFPDVHLWIALAVSGHIHHAAAAAWLEESGDETLAFCRVTQMGFLRLLTNERVMAEDVFTAAKAWRLLNAIRAQDGVIFAPEPPALERTWQTMTATHKAGTNFWTDTYLAAFAINSGYTLATLDRGFHKYKGLSVQVLTLSD
ncbi:MAG: TA system VapC family ribonuclease toxin [Bryobacteraceae bacterium]